MMVRWKVLEIGPCALEDKVVQLPSELEALTRSKESSSLVLASSHCCFW